MIEKKKNCAGRREGKKGRVIRTVPVRRARVAHTDQKTAEMGISGCVRVREGMSVCLRI